MKHSALLFGFLGLLGVTEGSAAPGVTKVELKPETEIAFGQYIQATERRLDQELAEGRFLWVDGAPELVRRVRGGEILVESRAGKGGAPLGDGVVHDWIAAVFIPGTTLQKALALVQDYDNHKNIYKPDVSDSKLLGKKGNDYQVFLRLVKKKVLTVVLNTYHNVHYVPLDARRWYSRSYSTRIAEVDDGQELPPGEDHGFLWRLDSYWRFEERDGGVYLECEAISLTRSVPLGLGWLINPIIQSLPRDSLVNTLRETREAL